MTHYIRAISLCVLVSAAVLLVPAPAAAQLDLGVKGGLTRAAASNFFEQYYGLLSDLGGGEFPIAGEDGGRTGVTLGLFADKVVRGSFGVRGEALFTQRGHVVSLDPEGEASQARIRLNYLDLAVLGRLNVRPTSNGNIYVLLGPVFNVRISKGTSTTVDGQSLSELFGEEGLTSDEADLFERLAGILVFPLGSKDLLKRATTSIALGVGITRGPFLAEFQFQQGLSSALRGSDAYIDALLGLESDVVGLDFSLEDVDVAALKAAGLVFDKALNSAKLRTFTVTVGYRF